MPMISYELLSELQELLSGSELGQRLDDEIRSDVVSNRPMKFLEVRVPYPLLGYFSSSMSVGAVTNMMCGEWTMSGHFHRLIAEQARGLLPSYFRTFLHECDPNDAIALIGQGADIILIEPTRWSEGKILFRLDEKEHSYMIANRHLAECKDPEIMRAYHAELEAFAEQARMPLSDIHAAAEADDQIPNTEF